MLLLRKKKLYKWLDNKIKEIPDDQKKQIVSYNFNLYEGINSYHIQLIGSNSNPENLEDWYCDEVYTSGEDVFIIKASIFIKTWEKALNLCKKLVNEYLKKGEYATQLKEKKYIGIGFVDGDNEIIYKKGE